MEKQVNHVVIKPTHKKGVLAALERLSRLDDLHTSDSLLMLQSNTQTQERLIEVPTSQLEEQTIASLSLSIGRLTSWRPNDIVLKLINLLNNDSPQAEILRGSISRNLSYNTPTERRALEHYRGVSAFATHNPNTGIIILEWGLINPSSGEAKLHRHLREHIDYNNRVQNGCTISSGHIATLKTANEPTHIFMLDRLFGPSTSISKDSPVGQTINTLYQNGIVPLTSHGYVQFPAF